jgi:hypothetical protein
MLFLGIIAVYCEKYVIHRNKLVKNAVFLIVSFKMTFWVKFF